MADESALGLNPLDWLGYAHNAIQDYVNPDRQTQRNPLPPQDELIRGDRPDFGYATSALGSGSRPMPQGDIVLRPGGESFEGGGLRPEVDRTPYIPQPSTNIDTRDFNEFRRGQGEDIGVQRASYAGDVLAPYATGNAALGAPSSVEGVKDMFADRIKTMVGDMPPNIAEKFKIISGFRDAARQHDVNPGVTNSRHSYGMAVDTTTDPDVLNWINNTNGKYGVDYTLRHLPNEKNHLEMVDNGVRAPLPTSGRPQTAQTAQTSQPTQTPSASAADQLAEYHHPVLKYENTLKQFPILNTQQIIAGPSSSEVSMGQSKLEYWPPNEPGTPEHPRPDYIPIDQTGLEIGPDATPMDILGDIVSHHMVKKDPVIKKYYESFEKSLTSDQKEQLQAQYNYAVKNENETRSYQQWEKASGLPAFFRGYAFGQWPADFNEKNYTQSQMYHFDRMMDYLRGNHHADRSALEPEPMPGQAPGAAQAASRADLSRSDAVVQPVPGGYEPKDMQTGRWAGGPPTNFAYPVSPMTNPFVTPEYGWRSSPTNPVLEDRPPQIPPGWSDTRGEHSRYRSPR